MNKEDELRSEYDFAQMEAGVRGKYVDKYHTENQSERSAIAAKYNSQQDQIVINFSDGSEFRFSSQLGQGLQNATPEQLAEVEVTPSGQGLHWETLDADLSIPDLLRGVYGNRKWMNELKQLPVTSYQ